MTNSDNKEILAGTSIKTDGSFKFTPKAQVMLDTFDALSDDEKQQARVAFYYNLKTEVALDNALDSDPFVISIEDDEIDYAKAYEAIKKLQDEAIKKLQDLMTSRYHNGKDATESNRAEAIKKIQDLMTSRYHNGKDATKSNRALADDLWGDIEDGKTQRALSRVEYFGDDLLRFESLETLVTTYNEGRASVIGKEANFIQVAGKLIDWIQHYQGFTAEQVTRIKEIATQELEPIAEKLSNAVQPINQEGMEAKTSFLKKVGVRPESIARIAAKARPGSELHNLAEAFKKNKPTPKGLLDHAERGTTIEGEGRQ